MKEKLSTYGKVEQCEEKDGMFHVRITAGFNGNAMDTFRLMGLVVQLTQNEYPLIHMVDTDKDRFHLILKA